MLKPALTKDMVSLLDRKEDLIAITKSEDRPVSVTLPQNAIERVQQMQSAVSELGIDCRIFFAQKSSHSPALLSALQKYSGIDVASEDELARAQQIGYEARTIIATGPKKTSFLKKLIETPHMTIVIDNYSELERLHEMMGTGVISVVLRLGRSLISLPGVQKQSRFGFDQESLAAAIALLKKSNCRLRGVAFHLDSQSVQERSQAIVLSADILLSLQNDGFSDATVLDIGGGYGDKYGLHDDQLRLFEDHLKSSVVRGTHEATFMRKSFGIHRREGRFYGELSGIDFTPGKAGVDKLKQVLLSEGPGGKLFEYLRDNLIELWLEPGNAIAAGSGVVAASIIDIVWRDGQQWLIVDMGRNQLCFADSEHIGDPLLLVADHERHVEDVTVGLLGHLCMETDYLSYRPITFAMQPQVGDVVLFTHTGAYSTEFSASYAIGYPLPARYWFDGISIKKDEL